MTSICNCLQKVNQQIQKLEQELQQLHIVRQYCLQQEEMPLAVIPLTPPEDKRPFVHLTIQQAAVAFLHQQTSPQSTRSIVTGLLLGGYPTTSDSSRFYDTVKKNLRRNRHIFCHTPDKCWSLVPEPVQPLILNPPPLTYFTGPEETVNAVS